VVGVWIPDLIYIIIFLTWLRKTSKKIVYLILLTRVRNYNPILFIHMCSLPHFFFLVYLFLSFFFLQRWLSFFFLLFFLSISRYPHPYYSNKRQCGVAACPSTQWFGLCGRLWRFRSGISYVFRLWHIQFALGSCLPLVGYFFKLALGSCLPLVGYFFNSVRWHSTSFYSIF